MPMIAKLPDWKAKSYSNGKNLSGDKETMDTYNVIALYKGHLTEVVNCRVYMSRSRTASMVHASIWVRVGLTLAEDKQRVYATDTLSGHGAAGGYGYHKASAAIGSAIDSAGIELYGSPYDGSYRWDHDSNRERTAEEIAAIVKKESKKRAHIGGVGDSAVESALKAIAHAVVGKKVKLLLVRN